MYMMYMHLGVNLRKAMIVGLGEEERSNIIDEFVREFCMYMMYVVTYQQNKIHQ